MQHAHMYAAFRQLATGGEIANLHSNGLGAHAFAEFSAGTGTAGPHGQNEDKGNARKPKKTKDLQMVVASKIAMLSGKHTEIMSLDARVKDCEKLYLGLIKLPNQNHFINDMHVRSY